MTSYNAVNSVYMSKSKKMLTDILKGMMGFKDIIISDWWSVNKIDSFGAGLDMNMLGGKH